MFTTSHKHHDHFKDSTFQFFTQLPKYSGSRDGYKYCEDCVKPTPGFVYHCEKNGCDLHPCCFNLPIKLQILDAELELSDKELSGKCLWCNKKRLKGSLKTKKGTKGNKKLQMAKKLFETLISIFIGDHIIITLVSLIVTVLVG
ncbi:hypothetical protein WN943_018363 [Citrus x changshan-huyou]